MSKPWLVIGGWSLPPDILDPLFGDDAIPVDVNDLWPAMAGNGFVGWLDEVESSVRRRTGEGIPGRIAGWSAGAIVALALASRIRPESLVLLSATPSFCAREGFRHGLPAATVASMRKRLASDRDATLGDFYRNCGASEGEIPGYLKRCSAYTDAALDAGLAFLIRADIRSIVLPSDCATVVFHGTDDRIVPRSAGEKAAELTGGTFVPLDGGHLFFTAAANRKTIGRHCA